MDINTIYNGMSQEAAQQPFDQTQRDPRDEQLVGAILGPEAEVEMVELVGGQSETTNQQAEGDLDFTKSEQTVISEIENKLAENSRRDIIEWAENFGMGENWVDEYFLFESDGSVVIKKGISMSSYDIDSLPKEIKEVKGFLNLSSNNLVSADSIPRRIEGSLYLEHNPLKDLNGLVGCEITHTLKLGFLDVKSIPRGIKVSSIHMFDDQTELITDARSKGYTVDIEKLK